MEGKNGRTLRTPFRAKAMDGLSQKERTNEKAPQEPALKGAFTRLENPGHGKISSG
jgi:hypothetical protein